MPLRAITGNVFWNMVYVISLTNFELQSGIRKVSRATLLFIAFLNLISLAQSNNI
jgi:hypothetical protein